MASQHGHVPGRDPLSHDRLISVALLLYPPAWRARYGEEIRALVADEGGRVLAAASLAWRAAPAWVCPLRHLRDRNARMRSSLGTVLGAWSALTAVGAVFIQLTQLQGFRVARHPLVGWAYIIFDIALAASVLVATAGGVPLWLQMLRQAIRERQSAVAALLWLTVAAPAGYLAIAVITLRVVHHPEGSGPWWFVWFAIAGFVVAGLACAGPISALHRLRPSGRAVKRATTAAGIAATSIALAGAASGVAATGLCLWAPGFGGYHRDGLLGGYLTVVTITAVIVTVSAAKGVRATLELTGTTLGLPGRR
jgi:hypothetical protein